MGARTITLLILLSLLLASFAGSCSCHGDAVGCVPSERESLLRFKQGLRDPANRLSSWTGEDCCKWSGVGCDEHTGYVTKVDLSLNPHDLLIDGENRLHSFTLEDWEDSGENVHDNRLCLGGEIHPSLLKLKHLHHLDLSGNNFNYTPIPKFLGSFENLKYLNLSFANFGGVVPNLLGNLSNLHVLDLSYNLGSLKLESGEWVSRLGNLQHLDISWVDLTYAADLFQALNMLPSISKILLRGCNVVHVPQSLSTMNFSTLSTLDLSETAINSTIPNWLLTVVTMQHLDLSGCNLRGSVPAGIGNITSLTNLDHSRIRGKLPQVYNTNLSILDLSSNSFSGPLVFLDNIADNIPNLQHLDMSNNDFSGGLPLSFCKLEALKVLDLAGNQLSGNFLGCLSNLTFSDLSGNQLSGIQIPSGTSCKLKSLYLNNNNLSGLFPSWLRNCKNMVRLDLCQNNFIGSLPSWIGKSFPYMRILNLRSNMFSGKIPPSLPYITTLQVLDLANNSLSGRIPQNFGNFSAMKVKHEKDDTIYEYILSMGSNGSFIFKGDTVSMFIKGKDVTYNSLLEMLTSLDLSHNMLSGVLPEEFGELLGLMSLNLSGNYLTGSIPKKISGMTSLESLDLSRNGLSGEVPKEMIELTFLSWFNLSYNNLSGTIPTDNQFQTFTNLSYIGNPNLCGSPLKKCFGERGSHVLVTTDGDDVGESFHDMLWLCLGIMLGFVVGFWAFCGTLLFKKEWRYSYFRFMDNIYERFI